MADTRPGLNQRRLSALMRSAVQRCGLDLRGSVVLTEAATGPYVVTPILAAMAGADRVYALTRTTRHGSAEEVRHETLSLARLEGIEDRVVVLTERDPAIFAAADIVTNSGHVRPIGPELLDRMKSTAVIPLMYEAWEFRPEDLDLASCARRGIVVAGTNERHPAIDVFSYLGILTVKLLLDAGVAVYGGGRTLLLCDNPFSPFIERGLTGVGAQVDVAARLGDAAVDQAYDVVVVALTPRWSGEPVVSADDADAIATQWPAAVVAQLWGDLDRTGLAQRHVAVWPAADPGPGHMGILLSALGPEPVIRLQAGGLKVGECLWRERREGNSAAHSLAQLMASGYGTKLADTSGMEVFGAAGR